MGNSGSYPELKEALISFRELFIRKILPPSTVNGTADFLKRCRLNPNWTAADAHRVYQLIKPHSLVLKKVGFDFEKVPPVKFEIPKSAYYQSQNFNLIGYDDNLFVIKFPYNRELIKEMSNIEGAFWNREKRYWNAPLGKADKIKEFGEKFGFVVTEKGKSMFRNINDNLEASYSAEDVELPFSLKLEPYPFQKSGIDYAMKNKRIIIGDEMGCIGGDAIININIGGASKNLSFRKLYNKYHKSSIKNKFKARVLKDSIFGLHPIKNIIFKGYKETISIITESGKILPCTKDHEILTPNGFIESFLLKVNDYVIVNGINFCKECGSTENIITYKYSKFLGYCKKCMYSKLRKNGKYKTGKFIDKDGYIRLTGYHNHPRSWSGGQIYEHLIIMEKHIGYVVPSHLNVHHKNGIKHDNRIENLELVTVSKHHIEHNKFLNFGLHIEPKHEKIISIKNNGIKDVYDMIMDDPYKNFVANGIVVHNCGKTIQAIGSIIGTNTFPVLVICPKSLRYTWEDEWAKFTNRKTMILDKKKMKMLHRYFELNLLDVAITNYDGARTLFTKEIQEIQITKGYRAGKTNKKVITHGYESLFKSIIIDEAHECRNRSTLRFKTIKPLCKDKEVCLALTGSPIVKGPADLGALLDMIGQIDKFGGYFKFIKQYYSANKGFFTSPKALPQNLSDLNIKLRSICFIRREKFQVMKELPDKMRQIIKVDIDNQEEYDHALINLQSYLLSKNVDPEKIDAAMRAELLVQLGILKKLSARGKLSAFKEFVSDMLLQEKKLVIFCWFKETANYIKDNFKDVLLVTGDVSDEEVRDNIAKFQNDPYYKLIVLTYKRGGTGFTLTAAHNWACIELGWTYKDQSQAEDRLHRISQKNNVNCYYFLGRNTVDERIYDIIITRMLMEKEATGSRTEIQTEESTFKDIMKLLMPKT